MVAASDLGDPGAWGVTLHSAKINGLTLRWADSAQSEADRARPVVLFMHGWPELWFSWRHQLKAVHAAGYRGIAPDMRGYGGSSAPEHMASYNVYSLAGDMLALLQVLGASKAALVGHDHGASLGWKLALLHPDVFVCYMAMSVPYPGKAPTPPLATMRKAFGDERKPETEPTFFYILHHQLPSAAHDYGQDTRAAFKAMYSPMTSTGGTGPLVTTDKLYVDGKPEPAWKRVSQPAALEPWLSQGEMDYFVGEYERTGWQGGLNWYRVMDLDWNATPQLEGAKVRQPCAFVAGSADVVVVMMGGQKKCEAGMRGSCEQLDFVKFIPDAGHWIQQERPQEVNGALLEFLGRHRPLFAAGAVAGPRSRL